MKLGTDADSFRGVLAQLSGLQEEDAATIITCVDQSIIEVVDPAKGLISERPVVDGTLSNCALMQAGENKSWQLLSAKGEFLKGVMVGATYNFPADYHGGLLREMTARYGPGEERQLRVINLLGDGSATMRLWSVDDKLWALEKGKGVTRLLHQDTDELTGLPEPTPPAEKGKPVSLDEIGLGGGLDLNDDLDDIPDVIDVEEGRAAITPNEGHDGGNSAK